jgi:hypothetical protein
VCAIWSIGLREELRLKEFYNGDLRKIFTSKRKEQGDYRTFRNEERYNLYFSANIITVMKSGVRWKEQVTYIGR